MLTNEGVWSPDSSSVVFDVRRNKSFNGDYIGLARLAPGSAPSVLYERPSRQAGGCGIAQFMGAAHAGQVAFILGPGQGDPAWTYQFWHRRGVIANASDPGQPLQVRTTRLDAQDYSLFLLQLFCREGPRRRGQADKYSGGEGGGCLRAPAARGVQGLSCLPACLCKHNSFPTLWY